MHSFLRRASVLALIGAAGLSLSACESIRDAAGQGKDSPDEFAVVTKAPLVVPPDFNLRPPAPGAAPTNQTDPTTSAETALYGATPEQVAASLPPTMSQGERMLLANAHVENTDSTIRQEIASDGRNMRAGDDSFTNNVMFWSAGPQPATGAVNVNPDSEAARLAAQRNGVTGPVTPQPTATPTTPDAPPPPPKKDDDGGWFDWF
jgi:Protein of unknown function (DUF3035)